MYSAGAMFDQLVQRRSPGEGNGKLPQYSCLQNSIDRGDRQTTIHGVIKILEMTEQLTWKDRLLFLVSLVRLSLLTTSLLNWFCYVTLILNSCVSISICLWVFLNSFLTHWFCNMFLASTCLCFLQLFFL